MSELKQITLTGCNGRSLPTKKIQQTGKPTAYNIRQGDMFNSDKIAFGNLPEDQEEIFNETNN